MVPPAQVSCLRDVPDLRDDLQPVVGCGSIFKIAASARATGGTGAVGSGSFVLGQPEQAIGQACRRIEHRIYLDAADAEIMHQAGIRRPPLR